MTPYWLDLQSIQEGGVWTSLDLAFCVLEEHGYPVDGGYEGFIDLLLLELLKLPKDAIHREQLLSRGVPCCCIARMSVNLCNPILRPLNVCITRFHFASH